jgi:DNA-binding Lrp family transcriptional regulator
LNREGLTMGYPLPNDNVKLSSTQLRIYAYLLESGRPESVRDIADALSIPSSSVHYHLKRLASAGIVKMVPEGFTVSRRISIEGYVFIWRKLIPRMILYSFFFIGVTVGTAIITVVDRKLTGDRILLLSTSILASVLFLYEGIEARRKLF